jgi:hypothetical protein
VEKSCIASLESIPPVKGEFVHFLCIFGLWSELLKKTDWTGFGKRCDRFCSEMLKKTGWTGFGNWCDRFWMLSTHKSRECALAHGGVAYVQSCLLWWFGLFARACF